MLKTYTPISSLTSGELERLKQLIRNNQISEGVYTFENYLINPVELRVLQDSVNSERRASNILLG